MYIQQSDEDRELGKKLVVKQNQLEAGRWVWESHWQECMDYMNPRKNQILKKSMPGQRRGQELFDSTAIMANQTLASALHSMLTNPATRFFELTMGNAALDEDEQVMAYLQETGSRMFNMLNNTNFQTEIHEVYLDEGSLGTGCMFMGEDEDRVMHFNARHMKEIFIDENNLGLIDTVYRGFEWKLKQIVQQFGEENLPPEVIKKWKDGNEDPQKIIHAVEPVSREDKMRGVLHNYTSTYVLRESAAILSKGKGFHEFPYVVPRWTKTSGEIYGRGPGMDMLPDIKMVNAMMNTTLRGAQKTVDPPLMVSDDGVIGRVRLTPGGLTLIRPGNDKPITPLIIDARIDFGLQMIDGVRARIRAGFFNDLFSSDNQANPNMTATEVNLRTMEKLRLMGPVLGRQHFEFLAPMIERCFGVMSRKGLLPTPPQSIQGKNMDVRYSSAIARAQMIADGNNFNQAIQAVAPIVNADPTVMDNIDGDKSLEYIFNMYGIPEKIMRSDRDKKKIRDGRAAAQAQAAQEQSQGNQAEAAGKVMPGMAQLAQAQNQAQQPNGMQNK